MCSYHIWYIVLADDRECIYVPTLNSNVKGEFYPVGSCLQTRMLTEQKFSRKYSCTFNSSNGKLSYCPLTHKKLNLEIFSIHTYILSLAYFFSLDKKNEL